MGKRLFLATSFRPGEEFLEVLEDLRAHLEMERVIWVKPQNMHLTFKFLGETEEEAIPGLTYKLAPLVAEYPSISASSGKLGIFGARYDPKVMWVGFDRGDGELRSLGESLLDACDALGWKRDRQNFVPHITLARIKFLNYKKRFRELLDKYRTSFSFEMTIGSVSLIESILHPGGPEYITLHSFPLKSLPDAS